jgi:hypothetical protein
MTTYARLRVFDGFSGLGGWGSAFTQRGHDVVSLDVEPKFGATITADALTYSPADLPGPFQVMLFSPPCEAFSILGGFTHWSPGYAPADEEAWTAMALVDWAVAAIHYWAPPFFIIENPVGLLRALHLVPFERRTVWYCHLGEDRAKPTDLWGGFPPSLILPGPCHNALAWHPWDCCCRDHPPTPRGTRTVGTAADNRSTADRSLIPWALSLQVCMAAERDRAAGVRADDYTGRLFV